MKHACEARYDRLVAAIDAFYKATESVAQVIPNDPHRAGRLSALSDLKAVRAHIESEEARHA